MDKEEIKVYLLENFADLKPKNSWGEISFFYNPDNKKAHGSYFFTLKEKDGENDKASNINRDEIFRINFGITKTSFLKLFNEIPKRPKKGCIIEGNYDFTKINQLTPHPVYGWGCWLAILNPTKEKFEQLKPLIQESYNMAVKRF